MFESERGIWLATVAVEDYEAGWYFADEIQQLHGPFRTIEEARELRDRFMEGVL